MNVKHIVSMLTALCSAASCIVPVLSHAEGDELSENLKSVYSTIEVDSPASLINKWKSQLSCKEASRVFINEFGKVIIEQRTANKVRFDIKKNADFDDCERIIKEICPDVNINLNKNTELDDVDNLDSSLYYIFDDDISLENMISHDISEKQAKEIFNALNDKGYIKGFYYVADTYFESSMDYMLGFTGYPTNGNDDVFNTLQDFITEKNLDCTLKNSPDVSLLFGPTQDAIVVVPNYDYDAIDLLGIYNMILSEIDMDSLVGANMTGNIFTGTEIDMFNAVDGDSNCDNQLDMADTVLIMQALANPNNYSLSVQGKFNADLNDDGITVGDAQAIQRKLLGMAD